MLDQAEAVPDPEQMRRRAREHEKTADRIEQRAQR
jgi:hypothetical protein